ncbi:5595_t:CDS:2 [Rhizophagus irregularis]|nr:5595_t:CDS:2 [Rhizophagus irregularis]
MAKKTELAIEATTSVFGYADTIISTVELAASVAIPLSQFIPLIKDVSDIFSKVADLYRSAQHNKNITGILMERISAANTSVGILQAREDLLNSNYYKSLQRLVRVLRNMKKFIEDITQYNTVQKFLGAKKIESEFKELCKEYDSSMTSLNFNLLVVNFNTETEDKIVKEDVEQLIKFQEALVESMNNVEQKVSHTNDQMNLVVERVSEMAITMQNMQIGGYRESFTTGTDIPKKYQDLVNKSVDPNPGSRPIFSRMLTVLQDIFRNPEEPTSRHNSIKAIKAPPERKMTQSTIAAAEDFLGMDSQIDMNNVVSLSGGYITL